MFTEKDLLQFAYNSIGVEKVNDQLSYFINGFPFINLFKPATIDDGIRILTTQEINNLEKEFENFANAKKLLKFVPASGAATRMFKHLFEYLEYSLNPGSGKQQNEKDKKLVKDCLDQLKNFAFYDDLIIILHKDDNPGKKTDLEPTKYINGILSENGLNYGKLPKGLLKFHSYTSGSRSAIEEHIFESIGYCIGKNRQIFLHFTVSPEHLALFIKETESVIKKYEENLCVKFNIDFSIQKPSTDTVAVDLNNQPFRENDGRIHFRPGGHGALIENLNEIDGDIIFIKNIDNVVPDRLKDTTIRYKKALAGYLILIQSQLSAFLFKLESTSTESKLFNEISNFYKAEINPYFKVPSSISTRKEKIAFFKDLLNRPVRVCGMVKNEGEPGGGPFWVKEKDGKISLQIVESSQINMNNLKQKQIFNSSTHFNPVDLVCGTKDYNGYSFNLSTFINSDTGFISLKSKDGKDLKALELPGLWNGAMAGWITLFVEVPLITFNPVKIINDLLRREHQCV